MKNFKWFWQLLITILGTSCIINEEPLDFEHAVGKYKSRYPKGEEILELRADSTYIYCFIAKEGEKYLDSGKWRLYDDDDYEMKIEFLNWPDRVDLYSRDTNNELPYRNIYDMIFLNDIYAFKKVYILRRSYDNHEYDFIKENK